MENMEQSFLVHMIIALLIMAVPVPTTANSARANLRHVDAGKSLPEKLSNAAVRSQKRLEALKSSLTSFQRHGRQLDSSYTSTMVYAAQEYMMEVEVGNPAKKFSAMIDTGSHLVLMKCSPCSACASTGSSSCATCPPTVLDPAQSTSFRPISCNSTKCTSLPEVTCAQSESNTCDYHYAYADGSYTDGQYAYETLSVLSKSGPSEQFDVLLGCAHTISGDWSLMDGLIGFAIGSPSFVSQAASLEGKFSYCLNGYTGSNDSVLFLGSSSVISDPSATSTPILSSSSGLYYVNLQSITVGNTIISNSSSSHGLNPEGTIFDSGTSLTYLYRDVFSSVKYAFITALPGLPLATSVNYDLCFNTSEASSVQFPLLSFQFDNGTLIEPPEENYLAYIDDAQIIKCLMIRSNDDGNGIIGNILQQNYLVAHDVSGMKISLLKTNCNAI